MNRLHFKMEALRIRILFFVLSLVCTFGSQMSLFNMENYNLVAVNHRLGEYMVRTFTECALLCSMCSNCARWTADAHNLKQRAHGQCILFQAETSLEPYVYTNITDYYTMSRDQILTGTESTIDMESSSAAPKTTSTNNASYIIGAVETVQSVCNLYSYFDIVVLTVDGVYVYDDVTHLYSPPGPCKPVQSFHSVFNAYPDLPDITEVKTIHSFNTDRVEIYTETQVWAFIFAGTSQFTEHGYPMSISDHLKSKTSFNSLTVFPINPVWSTLRAKYGTQERYFFDGTSILYYGNFLPYFASIPKQSKEFNVNGQNINPWIDLPDNVADVMLEPSQYEDFIVFTSDLKIYSYIMDYIGNINDPVVSIEYRGDIIL